MKGDCPLSKRKLLRGVIASFIACVFSLGLLAVTLSSCAGIKSDAQARLEALPELVAYGGSLYSGEVDLSQRALFRYDWEGGVPVVSVCGCGRMVASVRNAGFLSVYDDASCVGAYCWYVGDPETGNLWFFNVDR